MRRIGNLNAVYTCKNLLFKSTGLLLVWIFLMNQTIILSGGVLVICTRNRSKQIGDRLREFRQFSYLPKTILVVDSSDKTTTKDAVNREANDFPTSLIYVHTKPGLPLQRNFGIGWIFENLSETQVIHFLDDDIIPEQNYFFVLDKLFSSCQSAIAIGGFDKYLNTKIHCGLIRRMVGLGSRMNGIILKSGLAVPPFPTTKLHQCEWLVGGMQSFRAEIFGQQLFDSNLRMYGEDLDFYLKIAHLGNIYCSSELPVEHLNDPTNRDSVREINLYHNGIRWSFAEKYPNHVYRSRVLLAALALAIGEFGRFLRSGNTVHFWASIGNWEFLFRLATKQQVVQNA